ncbi:integrase catalytic domain-containing protein [Trichonephila clavata]|uniref:Integrase catalytic domain-containing protein n=1 Tax=Trichonephila clavata TaxID=2740835 RepID=A0A8X6F4M7_TRICU|nr:integrase catalytic domain-containing protein [Trichonephila clavata]
MNSTSDTTEALQLSEDMIHILSEAATSSTTLHKAWKHAKCLICRRFKVRPGSQITAPLPEVRIKAKFPFATVGIVFDGPIYIKNDEKEYIALFTCAATRAIHLEVVSSFSTEHFLLAFRRFIARRGICHTVNSDNTMTFQKCRQ